MGRWKPDARGRLEQAAMELFQERGYEHTTTAAIAERAGLTERTFFRHFADKREVLFGGASTLQELLVRTVSQAPAEEPPIAAVSAGLAAVAGMIQDGGEYPLMRSAVIAANPELQERELIKLAALSAATAHTLRARGVSEPAASLTAEAAIAVFKVAFERWIEGGAAGDFQELIRDSLEQLRALTGEQPLAR